MSSLKSPRFLYPEVPSEKVDDYDVAARLALHLWDSIPDKQLLQAATKIAVPKAVPTMPAC